MQRRRLVVVLPPDTFRALERLAALEDRAAEQQAAYLLRHALADTAGRGAPDQVSPAQADDGRLS